MKDRQGVMASSAPGHLIKRGTVVGYNNNANTYAPPVLLVQLNDTSAQRGKTVQPISVPISFPLCDNGGLFIGSLPVNGTPVTVSQGAGGEFHFINYVPRNQGLLPQLTLGEMLLQSSDNAYISLNTDSNIYVGSDTSYLHIFAGSQQYLKSNYITLNFENENHFNQAYREVGGIVKRDTNPKPSASSYSGKTKLDDDAYDSVLKPIGMDPSFTPNNLVSGANKNPPFVEHREVVYEFQFKSSIDDYNTESAKYGTSVSGSPDYMSFSTANRRYSRADALSLSTVAPNFLIEQIKGTVVDIFGNILDLNRMPIQVGQSTNSTTLQNSSTGTTFSAQTAYQNIMAQERRSIAYHFEINVKKDPTLSFPLTKTPLTINDDNYNAKLLRSRFSFDVDKEGQFKLNVPASSEFGNVALLTRAENYSTFATTDNSNPNQLWFYQNANNTSQDIFVDSFASPKTLPSPGGAGFNVDPDFPHGSITLEDQSTSADLGPDDRVLRFPNGSDTNGKSLSIGHGTAHHDILDTCHAHILGSDVLNYATGAVDSPIIVTGAVPAKPAPYTFYIPEFLPAVSDTIKIGTIKAPATTNAGAVPAPNGNAGGRSGSINLDGSLELNIGANTVDRQSLWLDCAGGSVVNLGKDKNLRSLTMGTDGDVFIQIGGYHGITNPDARFTPLAQDMAHVGTLDLRIMASGICHIFRIDSQGVMLMTPGKIAIHSEQGTVISSDSNIEIDCENLILQGRAVKKVLGGSI